jgi:hypothetical protein
MNFLENVTGLLEPAQPKHAPLGFAPFDRPRLLSVKGESEYDKGQMAIDASIDTRTDLPEHIREHGRLALYSELARQAVRNTVHRNAHVPRLAREGKMPPDRLIQLMDRTEYIRAVELARLTHFGERDIEADIHQPVEQSLLGNPTIHTIISEKRRRFKQEYTSSDAIMIGVKQTRMEHMTDRDDVKSRLVTRCRQLFILDMQHPDNPLYADSDIHLSRVLASHLDRDAEYPDWLVPAVTTYYAFQPGRLDELKKSHNDKEQSRRHYDVSPNMPVFSRDDRE